MSLFLTLWFVVTTKFAVYFEQGWMLRLHMASIIFVTKSHILHKDQLQIRCQLKLFTGVI
jgi:hypothetical protein